MAALAVATAMAAMAGIASMASMAAMAAAAASPLFPIRLFPVLFPLLKLTRFIDYYPRSSRNKEKGWVRSSLVRKKTENDVSTRVGHRINDVRPRVIAPNDNRPKLFEHFWAD
jgi:hypothetical protein